MAFKLNSTKSMGIKFGNKIDDERFNGNSIEWFNRVRHLGNSVTNELTDSDDFNAKYSSFVGTVDQLVSNFQLWNRLL